MRIKLILLAALILSVCAGAAMSAEDPSLRGWWKLDDGAGDTATDSSGRANDGTIYNLKGGLGQGGSVWDFDATRGIVASFSGDDGAGAYIDAGMIIPPMDLENEFTWAFWAKQHVDQPAVVNGSGNDVVLGNRYGGSDLQFIKFTPGRFEYYNDDPSYSMTIDYEDMPAGRWVHHVGVKNGATLTYYRDGVEAGTATLTKTIDENPFFMGGDASGERWRGWLSDVRLYERALSADEVKTLAETPASPVIRAWSPDPADGAVDVTLPLLQWKSAGAGLLHDVYFGTTPELTETNRIVSHLPILIHYYGPGIEPGVTYYWRVDEVDGAGTIFPGNVWSFTAMPLAAHFPEPADGAENVLLTPTLNWTSGQMAMGHHVYFGADRSAVETGAAEADKGALGVSETTYQVADVLEADTTYYWRVDETAVGGQINTGPVWSFTTVSGGPGGAIREWWSGIGGDNLSALTSHQDYPDNPSGREFVSLMEGPVNWSDNYGSRLYGWLYPPETGDYTFWISGDNNCELWLSTDADPANTELIATVTGWTESREWNKEANQQSAAVNLTAGERYYIEALMKEGTGGDNIAVAWQGPGISMTVIGADGVGPTPLLPIRAYSPYPANGAADTLQDLVLTWKAGNKAQQHEVYFGDDAEAVAAADATSPLFMNRQSGTSYDVGELEWGKTFYWRVDEINEGDPESPWVGHVWSFSTADFIPVDDFESYTDNIEAGEAIWQTWVDGLTNGTGSIVGYFEAPFAEQTIVHGGGQSMPLDYNNIDPPYYSEAELELAPVQNWTVAGLTDLTLYIRGQASNDPDTLYVAVQDSSNKIAVAVNPDPAVVTVATWTEWKIPLADLAGVNLSKVKKLYIGVGDRNSPTPDGAGLIFVDDIRVTKPEPTE